MGFIKRHEKDYELCSAVTGILKQLRDLMNQAVKDAKPGTEGRIKVAMAKKVVNEMNDRGKNGHSLRILEKFQDLAKTGTYT